MADLSSRRYGAAVDLAAGPAAHVDNAARTLHALRRARWPLFWLVLAALFIGWGLSDNARLFLLTVLNGL